MSSPHIDPDDLGAQNAPGIIYVIAMGLLVAKAIRHPRRALRRARVMWQAAQAAAPVSS